MPFSTKLAALVAFATPVFPAAIELAKRDSSGLEVTLSQVGNTLVKATVKNTADQDVQLMHLNFFNDAAPIKKVYIYRDGKREPL
jgi:deuterolysin